MRSPEPFHLESSVDEGSPATTVRDSSRSRAELVHRHLRLQLAAARAELAALEAPRPPEPEPEGLASAVGVRISEARRSVAAARHAFDVRARALLEVADERAAQMVADAEAEAHVLRAAAAWLRPTAVEGSEPEPFDLVTAAVS